MQEFQSPTSQASACVLCESKDQAIEKCMQLITLLKKKAKKYDDSKIRESRSLSSNTERNISAAQEGLKARILMLNLQKIENRHTFEAFQAIKRFDTKYTKSIHFSKGIFQKQGNINLYQFQTSESLCQHQNGKTNTLPFISFPHDKSYEAYQRDRLKAEFQMMVANKKLTERVKFLEGQLEESLRRQQKEIAKKRQSLSGLVEELGEKNQIIEDLRTTIKWLEKKLGAKENGILQCMLEEDSQALKKVVFRLENINDKLNIDLEKTKNQKFKIEAENKKLKNQIEILTSEVKKLKQENFQLEHQMFHVNAEKKQIEFISHKISGKVEKIQKLQKKWSIAVKSKECMKSIDFENSENRKVVTESTDSLQTSSHQDAEQKLQSVFIYLFHIEDLSFKLGSPELFDEEEKQLLLSHKQKYFEKLNQSFIAKKQTRQLALEGDQLEFNPFGDSVIDALNHDLRPSSVLQDHHVTQKMKLIEHSIENGKLIQKISELKERNLYIRNVILSLLKTLQIKSLKKETQGILNMLLDYFQYSETERNQIYQPKGKKIFGFI